MAEMIRQIDETETQAHPFRDRARAIETPSYGEQMLPGSLLNAIPDLVFYKDVDGVYLGCNVAFAEFVGQPAAEIVSKTDFDLFPTEVATFFREQDALVLAQGQTQRNEEWVTYPDGRRLLLETRKTPLYNDAQNLVGLVGISRDITALYQSQADLQRLRYVIEQSLDGTAVADLNGIIQFVNLTWATMHGYNQDELVGQHLSIFHTPAQLTNEVEPVNHMVRQTGQTQRGEIGHVRRDGSTFPTLMTVGLLRDNNSTPIGLVASAQDISEQKAAEQELRAREIRFRSLVDNIPGAVYRCAYDADFTMEFLSDAIEEITQYPSTEFTTRRRSYASLVYPEDAPLLDAAIAQAVAEHRAYSVEYRLARADGSLVWVYEKGTAVYNEQGEVLWLDGAIFDITERKRSEAIIAKRAAELTAVTEVSTAVATILETDKLLQEVVDLTRSRFNLYHAHIYLLNAKGDALLLAAGAGEIGQRMVAQRHAIALNRAQSLVAQAARTHKVRMVNNVQQSRDWLPNPLLPETRAEMAVPILIGERLLGVLDIQASEVNHFSDEDMRIQSALAAQIAIALENARSFEQSRRAAAEMNALMRRLTREGWLEYLENPQELELGYLYDAAQVNALQAVTDAGELQRIDDSGRSLYCPITIHGETIGQLVIVPDEEDEPNPESAEIVAAIAAQLSARLENLRLTEQTELALAQTEAQAGRLAALNEMAAALNEAQETADIFRIATDQVLRVVRGDRVSAGMLNDNRDAITIMSVSGVTTAVSIGTNLYLAEEHNLARAINEARVVTRTAPEEDVEWASLIIAPLISSSRVLGVINIGSRQPNAFTLNDENLLRQVAALVSSTIENRYLFEETENRAEQLAAINRTAQALSQYLDRGELLEAAYRQIQQIVPLDAFFITFYHAESNTVDNPIIYEAGQRSEQYNRPLNPKSYTYRVITSGQPLLVHLSREEAEAIRQDSSRIIGIKGTPDFPISLIFVPLIVGQRVIGSISVQSYQFNAYTQADVNLLDGVGRYLAVSLENVRLFQQAQERARREQLLREITAKVRGSADVDTVMRTAVQEIGRTLGRKAFIQLQTAPAQDSSETAGSA